MSTRLRRTAIWRSLLVTALLLAFQGYLGFNVIGGQYGIESQKQIRIDIVNLRSQSATLAAEIESYQQKTSLFDAANLDPDILLLSGVMSVGLWIGTLVALLGRARTPAATASPAPTEPSASEEAVG